MRTLSPAAWIILILLALFIVSLNISLFSSLRKKQKTRSPLDIIHSATNTLKQPWRSEDESLAELSKRVSELKPPDSKSHPPQI